MSMKNEKYSSKKAMKKHEKSESKKEMKMEWISIEDSLPEDYEYVLI